MVLEKECLLNSLRRGSSPEFAPSSSRFLSPWSVCCTISALFSRRRSRNLSSKLFKRLKKVNKNSIFLSGFHESYDLESSEEQSFDVVSGDKSDIFCGCVINHFWGFFLNFFGAELMLLGFISLFLTVTQGLISKICVREEVLMHMLPCSKQEAELSKHKNVTTTTTEHFQSLIPIVGTTRRLLAEHAAAEAGYCSLKVDFLLL